MAGEVPCSSYMALYILSIHLVSSSRSSNSNHWKMNFSSGKVEHAKADQEKGELKTNNSDNKTDSHSQYHQVEVAEDQHNGQALFDEVSPQERMMGILSNKIISADGAWIVTSASDEDMEKVSTDMDDCPSCPTEKCQGRESKSTLTLKDEDEIKAKSKSQTKPGTLSKKIVPLSCGKPVNISHYDHLRGISDRHQHAHIPEPDVAMVFRGTTGGHSSGVDMAQLEQRLRSARKEILEKGQSMTDKAAQVYNLIGNFWRIKGDTQKSIECFRKALHILPEDPEYLLNIARVLFNLQYLDDAIYLARKSLSHQGPGENGWLQHFTLGEILKTHGHPQEAALHLNKAAELNPDFQPAHAQLRELTADVQPRVTPLTLFVMASLVVGVLLGLLVGTDAPKSQRHFNRAMAMRSIKLGVNPRLCRLRKAHS